MAIVTLVTSLAVMRVRLALAADCAFSFWAAFFVGVRVLWA
jgi:hypothetical protein